MSKINRKNKKKDPYRSSVNRTYEIASLGLQSELLWLMTYQPFNKLAIDNCKVRIKGLTIMKKRVLWFLGVVLTTLFLVSAVSAISVSTQRNAKNGIPMAAWKCVDRA